MRMLWNREVRYTVVVLLLLGLTWTSFSPVSEAYSQGSDPLQLELGTQNGIQATAWIRETGLLSGDRNTYDISVNFESHEDGQPLQTGRAVARYASTLNKEPTIVTLHSFRDRFSGGPMVMERGKEQTLEVICVLDDGVRRHFSTRFVLN